MPSKNCTQARQYNIYNNLISELTPRDIQIMIDNGLIRIREDKFIDWIDEDYFGAFERYKKPILLNYIQVTENNEPYIDFI